MSGTVEDVTARTVAGVRWGLLLNLGTLPLSFGTNLLLARMGPSAIGYYGAIQLFLSAFQTFFVLGGNAVFTRLVPALPPRDRVPFLATYGGVVLGVFLIVAAVSRALVPGWVARLLGRFGEPGFGLAVALGAIVVVWAFTSHFLYAILEGRAAIVSLKSVVIGFFFAALGCWAVAAPRIAADPAPVLWGITFLVYAGAALLGLLLVTRTAEFRERAPMHGVLPKHFLSVVAYTHLQTLVTFVYAGLTPAIVLWALDVDALGHFHAAMRYPVLLALVPAAMAAVVAPGLSTLEAAGLRAASLRQTVSAIRGALVVVVPAVLALILFAGDAMALFGPGFRADAEVLAILALSGMAAPLVQLGGGLLIAHGAFRTYLAASVTYVAAAGALGLLLVPRLGLIGAALAATGGEIVQHVCVDVALRLRFGLRVGSRVYVAWLCGLLACAAAVLLRPGRGLSAALLACVLALFAWAARIHGSELGGLLRRLVPARAREGG